MNRDEVVLMIRAAFRVAHRAVIDEENNRAGTGRLWLEAAELIDDRLREHFHGDVKG